VSKVVLFDTSVFIDHLRTGRHQKRFESISGLREQKMKKAATLDKDEGELARSLENEEWVSDLTKKEKRQYEEYARYSLNKQKRINIRMSERDLKKIRAKAIEEGLPYQSLITMLIHKYNEGKVSINQ
jgi:predicted DNA binding CopG/RHH family protein